MAKQRKKNKKSSSTNGVAAMDTSLASASQASTPAPPPQAMDTSELSIAEATFGAGKISSLGVSASGSKKINKTSQKRRAVKLLKEKAVEKALAMSEKRQQKLQQDEFKAQRVQMLKKLY